jgi:DNA-binding protein HU
MAKTIIQQITNALAKQYNLSAAEATAFVDAIFNIISSELKSGNQVKIKGLGTFKVQAVKPRESVNVNTGERVLIEGHDKISFTPDIVMKELVNKPFSQFETVVINDGVDTEELERVPAEEISDEVKITEVNELSTVISSDKEQNVLGKKDKISVEISEVQKKETITEKEDKAEIISVKEEPVVEIEKNPERNNQSIDATESLSSTEKQVNSESLEESSITNNVEEKLQGQSKKEEDGAVECDIKPEEVADTIAVVPEEKVTPIKEDLIEDTERPKASELCISPTDEDNDVDGSENGMLKKVALIAFIVIVCLGVFLWLQMGSTKSQKNSKEVAIQANATDDNSSVGTKTISADTTKTASASHKDSEKEEVAKVDSFAALNHDPRIRYGAYNIIGVERVVVLKKGQTMEKYSRKTLGADMVGYFQVLNGRKTMQAGDTMKVPKVELRPEYRK